MGCGANNTANTTANTAHTAHTANTANTAALKTGGKEGLQADQGSIWG